MTLTERLAAKVLSSLIELLGKDNLDYEPIQPGAFTTLINLAGKLRILRVFVPDRSRVVFAVELGKFTEEENDWLRLIMRGYAFDAHLWELPTRTEAYMSQILMVSTVQAHLPAILRTLSFDLTQIDELLDQMLTPQKEELQPGFRIFPEQPDPAYMRPPGNRLH